MKLKHLFAGLFSCAAIIGLASCDSAEDTPKDDTPVQEPEEVVTLTGITVSDAKTDFTVGDEFATTGIKVTAKYSDNTTKDVTSSAKVTQSADMNKAGTYAVIISYEGQNAAYQITVTAPENVQTLKNITVNTTNVDLDYNVGDNLALAYLTLTLRYDNSTSDEDTLQIVSDLTDYTITITDPAGEVVEGAFKTIGTHEVTIANKDGLTTSYSVNVKKEIMALSVAEAIALGVKNSDLVNGGTVANTSYNYASDSFVTKEYAYQFGDGFSIIETDSYKYYYTLLDAGTEYEDIFAVQYNSYSEKYAKDDYAVLDAYKGYNVNSWNFNYESDCFNAYGAEDLISKLYEIGSNADSATIHGNNIQKFETNLNYCSDCGNATYSFYIEMEYNEYYYTIVNASFELNNYNAMDNVYVSFETYYESDVEISTSGVWKPTSATTNKHIYDFDQVIGNKYTENPYSPEIICTESFDLVDAEDNKYGEENADGTYTAIQIKSGQANKIELTVNNVLPTTADLTIDNITVAYGEDGTTSWGTYVSASFYDGVLTIYGKKIGTEYIHLSSTLVTKVIKIEVTELGASSSITPNVLGDFYGSQIFLEGTTTEGYTASPVYLKATFDAYTSTEYTATLKEEYTGVTIEKTEWTNGYNSQECYGLTATTAGTYVVVLTYTADTTKTCEITVTIKEAPTLAEIIANPLVGSISGWGSSTDFTVIFTPNATDNTTGSVNVSVTESGFDYYTYEEYSETTTASYTYAYDATTKLFTLTETTETDLDISLAISDSYSVVITYGYDEVKLEEFSIYGDWVCTYTHPMTGYDMDVYLTLSADNTGNTNGSLMGTDVEFTYTVDGSTITFTVADGGYVTDDNTATLNADLTLTVVCNGSTYTYSK